MLKLDLKVFQKKVMDYMYLKASMKDQVEKIDAALKPVLLKPKQVPL